MANFTFKEVKTTSMKAAGILDADNMTIDVDGEPKDIKTLLSVFNGTPIELNIKIKEESELDEPTASDEEDVQRVGE